MLCFQLRYVGKIGRRCFESKERVGRSSRLRNASKYKGFRILAVTPFFAPPVSFSLPNPFPLRVVGFQDAWNGCNQNSCSSRISNLRRVSRHREVTHHPHIPGDALEE